MDKFRGRGLLVFPLCWILVYAQVLSHREEREFPSLNVIPPTSFTCLHRVVGYYADTDPAAGCQVYHMCDMKGNKFSYLCPNGTLFHQQHLICAHWYQVNCTTSHELYEINKHMFPYNKFPQVKRNRASASTKPKATPEEVAFPSTSFSTSQDSRPTRFDFPTKPSKPILTTPELALTPTGTVPSLLQRFQVPSTPVPFPFHSPELSSLDQRSIPPAVDYQARSQPQAVTVTIPTDHNGSLEFNTQRETTVDTLHPSTIQDDVSSSQPDVRGLETTVNTRTFHFPEEGSQHFSLYSREEKCPQCHPYFFREGACSPCVIIR